MMATIDAGEVVDVEAKVVECLACDGVGKVCSGCGNLQDECQCDAGCSTLVNCEDCKGEGTKPVPADYAADPAGEMDLRDDEPMPAWKVELVAKIQAAELETQAAETDYLAAKETAKECKDILEGKIAGLRSLVRKLDAAEKPMPLLDGLDKPAGTNGQPAASNDGWRGLCIDTLALPETILESMRQKGIETLGGFANFQRDRGEFWAKDLKGVGPAKATKITEAWEEFWKANPQYCSTN